MRKVLVATHGRFAEGIRETMQFIMGDEGTVDVLNAYTSQEFDMHKEAERLHIISAHGNNNVVCF